MSRELHTPPHAHITTDSTIVHERRVAKCPNGDHCEVAERQAILMQELAQFRSDFAELKASMQEVLDTFNSAKAGVEVLAKLGVAIKYIAGMTAAVGVIWAAIVHWPAKH